MRIAFAAGGTGGHIMPALAVAEALKKIKPETEIIFFGVGRQLEKKLIGEAGYELVVIPFTPVVGRGFLGLLKAFFAFPKALGIARKIFKEKQIEGLLAFGGYPSVVPVSAAYLTRLSRALQEQNVEVGVANKFLSLLVERVYAVPTAEGFWNSKIVVELPNPVREQFVSVPEYSPPAAGEPWNLLVTGGSQGAVSLNDAVIALTEIFKSRNIHVRHQAGVQDLHRVKAAYAARGATNVDVVDFIPDMSQAYGWAHLVISRAGALSVAEIQASGRAAIFVPLPIAHGHQESNVILTAVHGAGVILPQTSKLTSRLIDMLNMLLDNPEKIRTMSNASRELGRPASGQTSATVIAEDFMTLCGVDLSVVDN